MSESHEQKIVEPSNKRGLARQQKFLQVAEQLFLTQGYANTSVNEVVRVSGGSLGTLYRIFGNKLGLFEAVFRKLSLEFFNELENVVEWSDDIEISLMTFGKHIQSLALSPDGLAIYRLVTTENNVDQHEIQKIFYTFGPQVAIERLSSYLNKQVEAKKLKLLDEKLAASQFIEMIKGPFVNRSLFGETVPDEELALALKQAVQLFLKGAQT